jgi:hypothetical protein
MVRDRGGEVEGPREAGAVPVVVTGPFIIFLLHNHFITEIFLKKKSGDESQSAG